MAIREAVMPLSFWEGSSGCLSMLLSSQQKDESKLEKGPVRLLARSEK